MTAIFDLVTTLIKRAKENEQIKDVRFVKAYKSEIAENPVGDYLVAVNLENVMQTQSFVGGYFNDGVKGQMYSAKLVLRVYADRKKSGEDLGRLSLKIQEALTKADSNNIISGLSIGPISFDGNFESIYREISVNLEFCLCGEE